MTVRSVTLTLFGSAALVLSPALAAAQTSGGTPTPAPSPGATPTPAATPNPTVGGVEMLPTRTIIDNASAAPTLSTLVSAVKAADLTATLSGPGPFTVFAPNNEAFARLGDQLAPLLRPERKPLLAKILTYHVVPGNYDAEALLKLAQAGGGKATLTTVEGEPLTVSLEKIQGKDALVLVDVNGGKAYPLQYNVKQSNGMVHIINGILLPTQKTDAPAGGAAPTGQK